MRDPKGTRNKAVTTLTVDVNALSPETRREVQEQLDRHARAESERKRIKRAQREAAAERGPRQPAWPSTGVALPPDADDAARSVVVGPAPPTVPGKVESDVSDHKPGRAMGFSAAGIDYAVSDDQGDREVK